MRKNIWKLISVLIHNIFTEWVRIKIDKLIDIFEIFQI